MQKKIVSRRFLRTELKRLDKLFCHYIERLLGYRVNKDYKSAKDMIGVLSIIVKYEDQLARDIHDARKS